MGVCVCVNMLTRPRPTTGFDTGPQFVFNVGGGGPGIRVHHFGGPQPRRRPREGEQAQQDANLTNTLMGLLPILLLFIFPLLSSLFSGGSSQAAMPKMVFDHPTPPYTYGRKTKSNVKYYVVPKEFAPFKDNPGKQTQLDNYAEALLVRTLKSECEREMMHQNHLREQAQGWFFQDPEKMDAANKFELKSCNRLAKMTHSAR